ncbi:hypothetical protein K502DRAFT_323676 [Neoconidiobolus thromboides FSU 785]|nr:hypothetical protein K502DRAFT_323676 [Neoconidiobolus thromboides FSU 785]
MTRRQRKTIHPEDKKSILELRKLGLSHQKIATQFDISRSSVTRILLNREKYSLSSFEKRQEYPLSSPINLEEIQHEYAIIEIEIIKWCKEEMNHNENTLKIRADIDKSDIIYKAIELAYKLRVYSLIGVMSWYHRFENRYKLQFQISSPKINNPVSPITVKSNVPKEMYLFTQNRMNTLNSNLCFGTSYYPPTDQLNSTIEFPFFTNSLNPDPLFF